MGKVPENKLQMAITEEVVLVFIEYRILLFDFSTISIYWFFFFIIFLSKQGDDNKIRKKKILDRRTVNAVAEG